MLFIIILLLVCSPFITSYINDNRLKQRNKDLIVENAKYIEQNKELHVDLVNMADELGEEREKNRSLLSQKKSSETRLGQISEHIIPFLEGCKHDPKTMHFLGNPIDYVVFNLDDGKIIFLEIKSGNSKPSKRQKTIKNIIRSGRVFYEEIRINEKGIKNKTITNIEPAIELTESMDEDENE